MDSTLNMDDYVKQLLDRPRPAPVAKTHEPVEKEPAISRREYTLLFKVYEDAAKRFHDARRSWEKWQDASTEDKIKLGKNIKRPTCYEVIMDSLMQHGLSANKNTIINMGDIILRQPVNYKQHIIRAVKY